MVILASLHVFMETTLVVSISKSKTCEDLWTSLDVLARSWGCCDCERPDGCSIDAVRGRFSRGGAKEGGEIRGAARGIENRATKVDACSAARRRRPSSMILSSFTDVSDICKRLTKLTDLHPDFLLLHP